MSEETGIRENEIEETLDEEEPEELSIVEKIVGVFISPVSTFRYLSKNPDFWTPFIVLSLIGIACAFLIMPVMLKGMELAMTEQMSNAGVPTGGGPGEPSMSMLMGIIRVTLYVATVLGPPINNAISWLVGCAIIFFIALFMGLDTDYKRLLGVVPWTFFMITIASIVNSVLLIGFEVTEAAQVRDPSVLRPFSLAVLLPDSLPFWQKAVASMIDPFSIWTAIALIFAVEAANRCKRSQALVITIIFVIIAVALQAGGATIGMAMQPR
jgi:hypothetical protein